MNNASADKAKLSPSWSPSANRSFVRTLRYVAEQDPMASHAMLERVERALALLLIQPGMGTPTAKNNIRRFPIPHTGHSIDYAVTHGQLDVRRWFRQRRRASP